ncbi:fucolectin-5-like [Mytilus trossulus]|uniref:fucolectin-5-like n=1 Tax=Mytilus trossulus TaxID=6551 RepID=UPI003005943D
MDTSGLNSYTVTTKTSAKCYTIDLQGQDDGISNVALLKGSNQSSLWSNTTSWRNNTCCSTDYAIDGNPATFSSTSFEYLPYWWVDLGLVYNIKRIEIMNRPDCCGERLRNLDITVGPSINDMALCIHYTGPGLTGEHLVFHCNQNMSGQYVKVSINGTNHLQLAEVMVFV